MTITEVSRRSRTTLLPRKTSEKRNPARGMRELPGNPLHAPPPERQAQTHVWLAESSEGHWGDTPTCALPHSALGGPGHQTAPHLNGGRSGDKRTGESTDTYALMLSVQNTQLRVRSMWDQDMQYDPRQDLWLSGGRGPQTSHSPNAAGHVTQTVSDTPRPASLLLCLQPPTSSGEDHGPCPCRSHTSSWGGDRRLPPPFFMRWGQASPSSLLPPGGRQPWGEAAPWTTQVRPHAGTRRAMRCVTSAPSKVTAPFRPPTETSPVWCKPLLWASDVGHQHCVFPFLLLPQLYVHV